MQAHGRIIMMSKVIIMPLFSKFSDDNLSFLEVAIAFASEGIHINDPKDFDNCIVFKSDNIVVHLLDDYVQIRKDLRPIYVRSSGTIYVDSSKKPYVLKEFIKDRVNLIRFSKEVFALDKVSHRIVRELLLKHKVSLYPLTFSYKNVHSTLGISPKDNKWKNAKNIP